MHDVPPNNADANIIVVDDTEDVGALLRRTSATTTATTAATTDKENNICSDQSRAFTPAPLDEWIDDHEEVTEGNQYDFHASLMPSINIHELGEDVNPFDPELQNALLHSEIQFIEYISQYKKENCFMVNRVQPILSDHPYKIGNNEFQVHKIIGRGSFGCVYRCVFHENPYIWHVGSTRTI